VSRSSSKNGNCCENDKKGEAKIPLVNNNKKEIHSAINPRQKKRKEKK
jgi:hypothetical protein